MQWYFDISYNGHIYHSGFDYQTLQKIRNTLESEIILAKRGKNLGNQISQMEILRFTILILRNRPIDFHENHTGGITIGVISEDDVRRDETRYRWSIENVKGSVYYNALTLQTNKSIQENSTISVIVIKIPNNNSIFFVDFEVDGIRITSNSYYVAQYSIKSMQIKGISPFVLIKYPFDAVKII